MAQKLKEYNSRYDEYTTDHTLRRHEERLDEHLKNHYANNQDVSKLEDILTI